MIKNGEVHEGFNVLMSLPVLGYLGKCSLFLFAFVGLRYKRDESGFLSIDVWGHAVACPHASTEYLITRMVRASGMSVS